MGSRDYTGFANPKTPFSIVKKIAVASIYSKPNSRKKTAFLGHITES
jgi:hypothetical protein